MKIAKLWIAVAALVAATVVPLSTPAYAQDVFNVLNYGADKTGASNDVAAFQATLQAAETDYDTTGEVPEVYIPNGTYTLGLPDGSITQGGIVLDDSTFPVDIVGQSRANTTIDDCLEGTSSHSGATIFQLSDNGNISGVNQGADGSLIESLSLDSMPCGTSDFGAGDLVHNYTNNTVVNWINGYAPVSSPTNDPNVFGVRTTATCGANNGPGGTDPTVYHYGNTLSNLVMVGYGLGGAVDVDVSCQANDTITHIQDTGAGVALYRDTTTTLSNYVYYGATDQENPMSWYIDGPSTGMVVSNVTATGSGAAGAINPSPNNLTVSGTILKSITASAPGDTLKIGDATNTTVNGSSDVDTLKLNPDYALNGLTWSANSVQPSVITCTGQGVISNLVGVSCPS